MKSINAEIFGVQYKLETKGKYLRRKLAGGAYLLSEEYVVPKYRIDMKRVLLIALSAFLLLTSCQDRVSLICSHFGVNLPRGHYQVVEKTEQWCPNGDGEFFVRVSFPSARRDKINDILGQMKQSGAIEMPMLTHHVGLLSGKSVPYVQDIDTGLYLIDIERNDSRNYSLIVYDEAKKELIIQTIVY